MGLNNVGVNGGFNNALLLADVVHVRHVPRKNAFKYKVYYLCLPLRDIPLLNQLKLIAHNRFNLFSMLDKDHPIGKATPDIDPALSNEARIRALLTQHHMIEADGDIVLLSMPRLFGFAFNPVSFWFCLDRAGQLRAVLSEVNNTFGEHHGYLSMRDDHGVLDKNSITHSDKIFHVSPFLEVKGHYRFRFAYGEERVGVWIDYFDGDTHILSTSLTGRRTVCDDKSLLKCFFQYPLVTIKVVVLIHFQALRLWLKSIRYHNKPVPPVQEITK
jgi:DUF1365 family protein